MILRHRGERASSAIKSEERCVFLRNIKMECIRKDSNLARRRNHLDDGLRQGPQFTLQRLLNFIVGIVAPSHPSREKRITNG